MNAASQTTILTIDDERPIRENIAAYLEDSGYRVLQAENGRIGLELFQREQPALVLVDLRMPEVDGLEVLGHVTDTSPDTPIIVVSGAGMLKDAIEALRLGAWDYVVKPIHDMAVLEHALRKALERARLLIENRRYHEHLEEEIKARTAELHQANQQLQKELSERIRAEEALRESTARYRAVVEDMPAMICRFRPDGTLTFVNREYCDSLSIDYQAVIGQNFFQPLPEEEQAPVKHHFLALTPQHHSVTYTHQIRAADGTLRWHHWTGRALFHKNGELREYQALGRDVTEEKLAREEKAELEQQLQKAQKMEAIGTLAGGIAHDFNNILGGIMGYTELIQDMLPSDTRLQHYARQTLKACHRAKDLILQILTFSRQSPSEKHPVRLTSIVKEALKLLKATFPAHIDIRYTQDVESGIIEADPTQIHQVLMNLCTNAAHAMREQGGVLEVRVSAATLSENDLAQYPELVPGAYLQLRIADSGHGVSADILERIFDPYFTTKAPHEGTGLGLSVTHGIVKHHGGAITVKSTPGHGTIFTVLLPMIEPRPSPEKNETASVPTGNERILFVDDEAFLVETGRGLLEQLGYHVVASMSSVEALEVFRAQPDKFDLVITDQTMPHLTGAELALRIRQIRPDIPVLLCTGFSEIMTEEKAAALGIQKLVLKPLSRHDMARAIRSVLDSRRDEPSGA